MNTTKYLIAAALVGMAAWNSTAPLMATTESSATTGARTCRTVGGLARSEECVHARERIAGIL